MDTQHAPHEIVQALDATAEKFETPCGTGTMMWRRWGAGAPLVLFHGGQGAWTHWIRNIPELAQHRTVWVPDLPGYGDSADPSDPIEIPHIVATLADGLRRLIPESEPFDLAAFSFGGLNAAYVAAELGPRVRNLVLVGAGGFGPSQRKLEFRSWHRITDEAELREAHRHNLAVQMIADPSLIDDLAIAIQTVNTRRTRTKSRALSAALGPIMDEVLPRVRARIHGIWGGNDVTAGPLLTARGALLGTVQPGATYTVIPNVGHWVAYEAPQTFNNELLRRITPLPRVGAA